MFNKFELSSDIGKKCVNFSELTFQLTPPERGSPWTRVKTQRHWLKQNDDEMCENMMACCLGIMLTCSKEITYFLTSS